MDNSNNNIKEKNPRVVIFTMICNLALLFFAIFLWIDDANRIDDETFLIYSGLTILPVLNMFVLSKYSNRRLKNIPSFLGLYLKRRRMEEENRIKELEKKSNKLL